ncbi:MAG: hypothetical protein K2N95_02625 [Lachnospiraceae bacterium]|nr:hypothetical protein [Lachnospiraceae bacterium]
MGTNHFLKHLKYDLVSGFYYNRRKWILGLGVFVLISDVSINNCNIMGVNAGYMGYFTYIMQGMPEYIKTETSIFRLPVCWLLFHAYLFFILCFYPLNDLIGSGQRILVLSENRNKWWYSKICWCILTVIGYYTLFCLSLSGMSLVEGTPSGGIDGISMYMGIDLHLISFGKFILVWIFMPILFSVTIGLLQMLIGIILKPVAAYGTSILILIASVYWLNPLMIGNYAMLLRNQPFTQDGVVPYIGIVLCIAASAFSTIVGSIAIEKKDIIG